MVLGPGRLAVHLLENQHCRQMYDKYAARKQPMPVALAIGLEPSLHYAAGTRVSDGVSELDYAGGIRGAPVEVILGKLTGLPIPATAEIAIEGMFLPGETAPEGPFGEWHGYYANRGLEPVDEPVIRVKAIYHRNNPILTCSSPGLPPNTNSLIFSLGRASAVWMALDKAGIPGIRGVWAPEELGSLLFTVVSIRQEYEGHSMKAARIASEASRGSARYIVMVDDDIDPSDVTQVMWAVATRTNPERSIEVLSGCVGSAADPAIPLLEKKSGLPLKTSRAIIDACRPFRDRAGWYPMAVPSRKLEERVRRKWASLFQGPE
jgi:4-hydroxy-3-polyprenylbenzoate decarboxylase